MKPAIGIDTGGTCTDAILYDFDTGKVLGQVKSAKIVVYKYKAKKNERKKQGHRQPYTKVEISSIVG